MAFTAADWTIDRQTGNIRYIGDDHGGASPSYATVIELHRALQDYADDASSTGDDELDITDANPTDRSTDNIITLNSPWNIDDTAAEHLYDGSITQSGGDVIYDGIVNYGNVAAIQIIQNGAVLADDWWNSGGGLNADSASGISHRFIIKVRTGGSDIDGRRLIGTSRTFGYTYSEFKISGTNRGNNVLALSESTDLNNQTASGTVSGWSISNTSEGYTAIDVNGDTTDEYYYSEWDKDAQSINDLYEYTKYLTRDGSSSTLYGLNGELFRGITHQFDYDGESGGPFTEPELLTWSGGSGQLLAIDDNGTTGTMWIQLLTGTAPANDVTVTGDTSSATAAVNGSYTERTVSTPFIGVSTGSAIIGAFGVGIEAADLSASDKVFDLTNTQITPPNNVTFTVSGLASGDRVLVTNDASSNIDYDQLELDTTLSGGTETSVVVTATIPTDTPSSGTIRVQRDDGTYSRHPYSAYSGDTFTITSHDFSSNNATAGNNVFISYIDDAASGATMSFTSVYSSDRTLFVRVRDGGVTPIKPFETTGTLGSSGGSATAIRTSDS